MMLKSLLTPALATAASLLMAGCLLLAACLPGCAQQAQTTESPARATEPLRETAEPQAQTTEPVVMPEENTNEIARNDAARETSPPQATSAEPEVAVATFGAGCFWCVEAVFLELDGVVSVESGYCNGHVENPTYEMVCSGLTGHAEVCQVKYRPDKIGFDELLEVFWKTHDPTTLNRQGGDTGTQYRSAVFYHNTEQQELAAQYKRKLDESGAWDRPIVTEITQIENYYPAEDYHQGYYAQNPDGGYCRAVIRPKLDKFRKVFADKLKASPSQAAE